MCRKILFSSDATLKVGEIYDVISEKHHGVMEQTVVIVEISVDNIHHDRAERPHSFY